MKLLSSIVVMLSIISTVLSNAVKTHILDDYLDYKQIFDLHYKSDMTDKEIANWISDGIKFAINSEIINKNITEYNDVKNIHTCAAWTGLIAPCIAAGPVAPECIAGVLGVEGAGCYSCWI
ncbi:hypothetical protein PIROE2DRAFT_1761 [Piromyces sp. E2]|nr:hypothetical protein PIROE2DRAFT_1761 [Piromyces sp. E2]|eukprot:OUM70084.1 hypothetical protein PIROE2DRAFT_1761 [Piromyces sp. E2]